MSVYEVYENHCPENYFTINYGYLSFYVRTCHVVVYQINAWREIYVVLYQFVKTQGNSHVRAYQLMRL